MVLLGSQEGEVEDRRHTHPPHRGSAGCWPQAEQFEPAPGSSPCHTDQVSKADRPCPVMNFRVLA
jgi:hypothetical protein